MGPDQIREFAAGAKDLDAVENEAAFLGIIVDEAANVVIEEGILAKVADERSARRAGSVNQGSLATRCGATGEGGFEDEAHAGARSHGQNQAEKEINEIDRTRNAPVSQLQDYE